MSISNGLSTTPSRPRGRPRKYPLPINNPTDSQNVHATSKDVPVSQPATVDSTSIGCGVPADNANVDNEKLKKRRKNFNNYLLIKRRVAELFRRRRPDDEQLRHKLNDNRIPIILLERIKNGPFKPKLAKYIVVQKKKKKKEKGEEKVEEATVKESPESVSNEVEAETSKKDEKAIGQEESEEEQKDVRSERSKDENEDVTSEVSKEKSKGKTEVQLQEAVVEKKEMRLEKSKKKSEILVEAIAENKEVRFDKNESKKEVQLQEAIVDKKKVRSEKSKKRKEVVVEAFVENKEARLDKSKSKKEVAAEAVVEKKGSTSVNNKEQEINLISQVDVNNEDLKSEKSKDQKEAKAINANEVPCKSKVKKKTKTKISREQDIDTTILEVAQELSKEAKKEEGKEEKAAEQQDPSQIAEEFDEDIPLSEQLLLKTKKQQAKTSTSSAKSDSDAESKVLPDVVIRVDKKRTEHLIDEFHLRISPRHRKPEVLVATSEVKQSVNDSVMESDSIKCATEQSDDSTLDVPNECTKKPVTSLSGRRRPRVCAVDKVVNRLVEDDSTPLIALPEPSLDSSNEVVDDQSERSKKPVSSNKRLRSESVDQINDKDSVADSIECKPKCVEGVAEDRAKRASEDSSRDAKKYSNDKNHKTFSETTSDKEDQPAKIKLVSKQVLESNVKPKKSLASKSVERNVNDGSTESEKLFDKNLRSRKTDDKGDDVVSELSVEEVSSNSKGMQKLDKKVASAKNETAKVKRKADDKQVDNPKDDSHVNIVENSVEDRKISEIVDKDVDVCFEIQTETNKRCTRNASDKSHKLVEVQSEPKNISSDNCVHQSQIVNKDSSLNISKSCDDKVYKRVSKKSVQLPAVEEKLEKSTNLNEKVASVSDKSIINISSVKDASENSSIKLDEKAAENHTKSINDKNHKVPQNALDYKRSRRNNMVKSNNEKVADSSTSNHLDSVKEQCHNEIKESKKRSENRVEKGHNLRKRSTSVDTHIDDLTKNIGAEKPVEIVEERHDEKLNKDANKSSENLEKNSINIDRRKTRRTSERKSESENVAENKSNEVPEKSDLSIRQGLKEKVDITKRVRRKSLSDKTDEQPIIVARRSSAEDCSIEEPQKLLSIKDHLRKSIVLKSKRKVSFQSPEKSDKSAADENQANDPSTKGAMNELPDESQKTAKKVQTESKIITRTYSKKSQDNSSEKSDLECLPTFSVTKSSKVVQYSNKISSIGRTKTKSEGETEKPGKEPEDEIDDCPSKAEKRKLVLPERPNGSLIKKKPEVLQAQLVKVNEKQHEMSQEVIKECSKSQTENNKKVTRKASSDKHERLATDNTEEKEDQKQQPVEESKAAVEQNNAKPPTERRTYNKRFRNEGEGHSYLTRHSTEKRNEVLAEESHQLLKDCVKVQNHVLKRCRKKSSSDKNDKGFENAYSNLDEDEDSAIISERLDNKENSKSLLDNARMTTRSAPLKRDKLSKNLVENHVDCTLAAALQEEKNTDSIARRLRKTSVDKIDELLTVEDTVSDIGLSSSFSSIEEFSPEKISKTDDVIHVNFSAVRQLDFSTDKRESTKVTTWVTEETDLSLTVKPNLEKPVLEGKILESDGTENKTLNDLPVKIQSEREDTTNRCSRRLAQKSVSQKSENHEPLVPETIKVAAKNGPEIPVTDPTIDSLDLENLENEIKAYVIVKPVIKDFNKSLVTDNTKAPEPPLVLPVTETRSDLAKESLKSFLRKKRITRHSLKNSEKPVAVESSQPQRATSAIIKDQNHDGSEKSYDSVNNLSKESVAIAQSLTDNINDIVSVQASTSDDLVLLSHVRGSSAKDTINNLELSSSKRKIRTRTSSADKSEDIPATAEYPNDIGVKSAETKIDDNDKPVDDEAKFSRQRRQITLQELKKKCTQNLNKKRFETLCLEDSSGTSPEEEAERSSDPSSEQADDDDDDDDDISLEDSEENLATRLARLNGLEIPAMDNLDSGVQSPSDDLQQRVVDKIVLRCPSGASFIGLSEELQCKYCDNTFISHRDLKKHTRVQHRQRLIIKITKTTANERVTHVVEPLASPPEKDSTNDEDDEEEEEEDEDDVEDEDEENGAEQQQRNLDANGQIIDGEIKIIVKKQNHSRNSHVVKEIKITPRTPSDSGNSSCRLPSCSPAKSDLSGGSNSCRYPAYSPAKSDFGQVAAAPPRKRGRPRKYPIFTESELYAKQLAASAAPEQTVNVVLEHGSKKDESVGNVLAEQDKAVDASSLQSATEITDEPKTGLKRKRSHTLSQDSQSYDIPAATVENGDAIPKVQDDKATLDDKRSTKVGDMESIDADETASMSSSLCEPEVLVKYDIKKELVVKLTKIDKVPIANVDSDTNASENEDAGQVNSPIERRKRGPKPKVIAVEVVENGSSLQTDPVKATVLKQIVDRVTASQRAAMPSSLPKPSPSCVVTSTREAASEIRYNTQAAAATDIDADESLDDSSQQTSAVSEETASKILESIAEACNDNEDSSLDDNFEPVSESLCTPVTTQQHSVHEVAENGMVMPPVLMRSNSTVSSAEPIPKPQAITAAFHQQPHAPVHSLQSPPPLQPIHFQNQLAVHHNSQQQQQQQQQPLHLMPRQQQFCILFIPDALYNPDTPLSRDMAPTATLVNFQPVPDAEIANKPLIFTPTTPSKQMMRSHESTPSTPSASEDPSRSFTCGTCSQVQDLIGRLEASLGMTEEDKSAIKCPYCSNHFQSLCYLEYHLKQEHHKCENEKQCRHGSSLRIPSHETASEYEVYITFALKCRSCYDIFNGVMPLNDHVMHKHKTLVRFKPSSSSAHVPAATVSSSAAVAAAVYPAFARRNGGRPALLQSACPSDCVCRIGIRSTDSPLQRQEMIRRCPSAMRRLEKIEPAAYEVYTCTLCNSTFLMKDEVVDHLMKMHEVSCKFPCYTCLTSFRTLQLQENHRCAETTFQDLDKLLNIAILPTIGSTADAAKRVGNKYPEDSSSTDEYSSNNSTMRQPQPAKQLQPLNGFKRKNGQAIEAIHALLTQNEAKRAKLNQPTSLTFKGGRKRRKVCPKCGQRFAIRKNLLGHMINNHIILENGTGDPKEQAIELLNMWKHPKRSTPYAEQDLAELLSIQQEKVNNGENNGFKRRVEREVLPKAPYTGKRRGRPPKAKNVQESPMESTLSPESSTPGRLGVRMRNEPPSLPESSEEALEPKKKMPERCARCNNVISLLNHSVSSAYSNSSQNSSDESSNMMFCDTCRNGGPSTRRLSDLKTNMIIKRPRGRPPRNPNHPRYLPSFITKSFMCKICPASFVSLIELKVHKTNAHPKAEKQQQQPQLFTCEICDKSFFSMNVLEKHMVLHNFLGRLSDGKEMLVGDEPSIVMRVGDLNRIDDADTTDTTGPAEEKHEVNNAATAAAAAAAEATTAANRRDSSDCSCSGADAESKDNVESRLLSCPFCDEVYASKVSLKNHLKRDHNRRASICQFCNRLLINTSEVRHMLDYHIVPSKANRKADDGDDVLNCTEPSNLEDDVEQLVRVLGRQRLQSLMMYHDFEGKCNNAIMRCPICPEIHATRESCRFHYVCIHDDSCLLCDETFRSGTSACQHKTSAHSSLASYFWCIQRLVTAIVNTLKLDPGQPSHVLYQMLTAKLEEQERQESVSCANSSSASGYPTMNNSSDAANEQNSGVNAVACHEVPAPDAPECCFLEEVVLSEDQLPDAGNMIEVVIGREDSEDDLLSMLNLSPSYENSCEQRKLTKYTGDVTLEDEEGNGSERLPEALLESEPTTPTPSLSSCNSSNPVTPSTPTTSPTVMLSTAAAAAAAAAAAVATPGSALTPPSPSAVPTSPPVVENSYVSSGICTYKVNNVEEIGLVVTDEDVITYKDDVNSLALKISATCNTLSLEQITSMLKNYLEAVKAGEAT